MDMEKFAEVCGIHAGDGWISSKGNEVGYATSIQEEQYFDYVYSLYSDVFGFDSCRISKESNIKKFRLYSKEVQKILMDVGFPKGPKTYIVSTPSFVFTDKEFMKRFLRGLIDTDGCVHWKPSGRRYYISISWTSSCRVLANQIRDMLIIIGFKPCLYQFINTRANNMCWRVLLQSMDDTTKFMKEIGFMNHKKWEKFLSNAEHQRYFVQPNF